MQFERAEYAAPGGGRTCAACQQAITAEYFEARGALLVEFPMCVTDDPVPDQKAAQTK